MKLVAYFSLDGEQYDVGVIKEGNTARLARMIATNTGGDLLKITPVIPYPATYAELLAVSQKERNTQSLPEFVSDAKHVEDYDTVFIGYPNWWADMPRIVYHFLMKYDFSNATIIPFCTHGGSGFSQTIPAIQKITGGILKQGFEVTGKEVQNEPDRVETRVIHWLKEIQE